MKQNLFIQILVIFSLLFIAKSLDNTTLSNYKDITLINLEGIFEPNFTESIVYGDLNYTFTSNENGTQIILDTKNLVILNVTNENGTQLEYTCNEEPEDENLGSPLIIEFKFAKDQNITINVKYRTTLEGNSAQFLTKEQTYGKEYEYFFTDSEMILGRELLPSQDTPAVKFPFYLGIRVPNPLRGMISGIFKNQENNTDGTTTFYYKQEIPVPNYLIALAAGNIVERKINEQISVFSEPIYVDKVYNELYDFLPDILNKSISYMGEYEWGKYNVLVLPNSFPYSGMENPCLTFSSPCLINGDKSLVDIIAHELIHSWSGNLVTNENWRDFWLNEGITMFLQRKVIAMWMGEDYAKMDAILGLYYIEEALDYFEENSTYTSLRPDLTGISPDDIYSDIPYEKGYNFMYYIENLIGYETMKEFFKNYFIHFKYKSLDFYDFKNYFLSFCEEKRISNDILNQIYWDKWIYTPGRCPFENDFSNKYKTELDEALEKFTKGELDVLKDKIKKWNHTSKTVFMNALEQREEFLTEQQHDFITNTLKLYEENFLVKTNYFRLILATTDKFYDIEKKKLIEYLSNNGASDYMAGIYGLFYKRDEVLAEETLNNLATFYHSIMYEMAEEEINEAKENFPILSLELKNENQCTLFSSLEKIEIISEEYKKKFESIKVENGVFLKSEDNKDVELECYIDSEEKYCKIKNLEKSGKFNLNVPLRVQNQTYAIKTSKGNNKIKIYLKETTINETETKKEYYIDYNNNENNNIIKISFENEPDESIKIKSGEKEIAYTKKNNILELKIDETYFEYNKTNSSEYKEYKLKIIDICDQEKYSFSIFVKNTKKNNEDKDSNGIGTVAILFIIIAILLVVVIASFFIYRALNKKKNVDIENIPEKKLLSEI